MAIPTFHAQLTLKPSFRIYGTTETTVGPQNRGAIIEASQFPCSEEVNDARCMPDGSGGSRCQQGFPGETCYNIRQHFGHWGCTSQKGTPPCDQHGCGFGKEPHSRSQTCHIQCRFFGGICNFAKVTKQCPTKFVNGKPVGNACCSETESKRTKEAACNEARSIIKNNSGCKTNCRIV